jgi:hypothetical protein
LLLRLRLSYLSLALPILSVARLSLLQVKHGPLILTLLLVLTRLRCALRLLGLLSLSLLIGGATLYFSLPLLIKPASVGILLTLQRRALRLLGLLSLLSLPLLVGATPLRVGLLLLLPLTLLRLPLLVLRLSLLRLIIGLARLTWRCLRRRRLNLLSLLLLSLRVVRSLLLVFLRTLLIPARTTLGDCDYTSAQ